MFLPNRPEQLNLQGVLSIAARQDCHTIVRNPYFASLAGKVQVDSGHGLSTRLSHTKQVAKNGVSIAQSLMRGFPEQIADLGGIVPMAVKAAAYIHDIGHPQLAHVGEEALNDLALAHRLPRFNSNAHSLRVVAKLARVDGRPNCRLTGGGLKLSQRTLNGLLKYPWRHGENPAMPNKFGVNDVDVEYFRAVRQGMRANQLSLEAAAMDLGDDFAYVIDDMLDFFRKGCVPLNRISFGPRSESGVPIGLSDEAMEFLERASRRNPEVAARFGDFQQALMRGLGAFPLDEPYDHSENHDQNLKIFRELLTQYFVDRVIPHECGVAADNPLSLPQSVRDELEILKELTWQYVILAPEIQEKRAAQCAEMRWKGEALLDAAHSRRGTLFASLPQELREVIAVADSRGAVSQAVIDFLASLNATELARIVR